MHTPWEKSYDQPRQHIKKQRCYFANKSPSSPGYGFSSSLIWMWELDCKESWVPKNWCFWTVVSEKTLENPLDCKEIQSVNPKGNQSWIFTERTDAEVEAPILWSPHTKNWLIWKDPDAGKDLKQEEKGTTEDEMVGWHHWLNGHDFEQAPEVGDGQGSVVCCSPWGCKELNRTEWLHWTDPTLGSSHDLPNSLASSLPFSLSFTVIPLHHFSFIPRIGQACSNLLAFAFEFISAWNSLLRSLND